MDFPQANPSLLREAQSLHLPARCLSYAPKKATRARPRKEVSNSDVYSGQMSCVSRLEHLVRDENEIRRHPDNGDDAHRDGELDCASFVVAVAAPHGDAGADDDGEDPLEQSKRGGAEDLPVTTSHRF